jgi:hypothetical protein
MRRLKIDGLRFLRWAGERGRRNESWPRRRLLVVAAASCLGLLPGCATLVCTVLSPVTVPIDLARNANTDWVIPIAPIIVVYGIALCPLVGAEVDWGLLKNGDYSQPPFDNILQPLQHLPGH